MQRHVARAVARWGLALNAAPTLAGDLALRQPATTTAVVGGFASTFVRRAGTFGKDTSKDKGDVIDVRLRDASGRIAAKKLRKEGRVPAILFRSGSRAGEHISLALKDIERLVTKHGHVGVGTRVLKMRFEGTDRAEDVIAKQVHLTMGTGVVENATFMPVEPTTEVNVDVPVTFIGEDVCPGVKQGGFPWVMRRSVPVKCQVKDIPRVFNIDVSNFSVGKVVFLKDLHVPESVKLRLDNMMTPVFSMSRPGRGG